MKNKPSFTESPVCKKTQCMRVWKIFIGITHKCVLCGPYLIPHQVCIKLHTLDIENIWWVLHTIVIFTGPTLYHSKYI